MSHPWDWDYLMHRYFAGEELTEEQRTALNERLRRFPRLRKRFAEMAFEQASLRDALAVSEAIPILIVPKAAEEPVAAPLLKPLPPAETKAAPRWIMPVAAAAIVLVSILVWSLSGPGAPYEVVSGDVKVEGAKVEVSAAAPALFRMKDGSEARLAPSTSAVFHGRKDDARQVVEIARGGGTFKVAKAPDSFRVDTPAGRVLVLGTEFTVDLRKQKKGPPALAVSVVSGKVRVDFGGKGRDLGPGESRVFGEVVEKKDPPAEVKKDPPAEVRKPPTDKKEPRPAFNGSVRGKVVGKGDAHLLLAVETVVSSRKDSSPEIAEGLPGRTLKVLAMRRKDADLAFDKMQVLFIRKVEIGQELTLDLRQVKGDEFSIGALTEEQHQWAMPREERKDEPKKKPRDSEKSPDRPDKREEK